MKTALCVFVLGSAACAEPPVREIPFLDLEVTPDTDGRNGDTIRSGTFTVWENRGTLQGRTLELGVVVLPARAETPKPDPMFIIDGGPGLASAERWSRFRNHWMRDDRDIVLLSQRGTGGSNRLDCHAPGGPDDVQAYLDPVFGHPEAFAACLDALRERADLRWYGTAVAMDDLDDLRVALGYETINLVGGSYGTRASLEYIRHHGEHVRTATLNGVAPVSFINPLFHAEAAQQAIDRILAACAEDPECDGAFDDLSAKLTVTLLRLEREPAAVEVFDPASNRIVEVRLSRDAFAEAMRMLMYYDSRRIPYLIDRAFEGDFDTFAQAGFASNRAVRDMIAFGMLLCVTCNEDLARIKEQMIIRHTGGTFLRDVRVRQQLAVCALWPEGHVPDTIGDPVVSDVPVLMLSGYFDPVSPPRFATEAAKHLPNALHLICPGSHGVGGPCIERIRHAFLEQGGVVGLDTSCVDEMSAGPFVLPDAE